MASLFRRGLPALVLAGTGGVLLARFDHTDALTLETGATTPSAAAAAPAAPSTTLPSLPFTPRSSTATPAVPSTTRPSTATPTVPTAPSTTVTPAACTGAETLGPVIETRWGPVQVAAIISQGKICDVRAVTVPSSHTRSTAINSRAVPILRQRVLAAQSAAFDTVSGATVTSEGYRASLQAILNAAK
jgi:uncharacterized protein with FMN-binding domain